MHRKLVIVFKLVSCYLIYGSFTVFSIYAFVGTLSNMYLFHIGNAVAIVFMNNSESVIERYLYPIISFLAYATIRYFQQPPSYILVLGSLNIIEQCIGSKIMRYFLNVDDKYLSSTLKFISVIAGISFGLSLCFALPGSYIVTLLNSKAIYKRTLLIYYFSHFSGNYLGLYSYYVLRDKIYNFYSHKFMRDYIIVCSIMVTINSFENYEFFQFTSIILVLPILAYMSVTYNQIQALITELTFIVIIFVAVILNHGPYIQQRVSYKSNLLNLIMSLYTIVISSSIMSSFLAITMQQRRKALSDVTKLKNELFFVSSQVSHDIRAPIMYIMNLCTIVLDRTFTDNDVIDAHDACISIIDIMDTWLIMLHSSANKNNNQSVMNVNISKCNISILFNNILKYGTRSCKISSKDLSLTLTGINTVPEYLNIDKKLINYVIINLLSNSIKYTNQGSININVDYIHNKFLKVRVSDTGKGIKEEDLSNIFVKFFKVNGSKDKYDSHGIGLYIVETLVNLMKGKIEIKSEIDMGTSVSIIIPAQISKITNEIINYSEDILTNLKVCIAEDDKIIQITMKRMLNKCEIIDIVSNGKDVIDKISKAKKPYDILFLDGILLDSVTGSDILNNIQKKIYCDEAFKQKVNKLGIIIISGTDIMIPSNTTLHIEYCNKPFVQKDIINAVYKVRASHSIVNI